MDARSILIAMLPIILTLVNYSVERDLLWSIFLGNKSKKSASRIKAEQNIFSRWTQQYIRKYLTKYQKDFTKWSIIKYATLALTVAQIVGFTIMVIFEVPFWIVAIVSGAIVLLNVILFMVMMNETNASDNKHDRKGTPWKYEQ